MNKKRFKKGEGQLRLGQTYSLHTSRCQAFSHTFSYLIFTLIFQIGITDHIY